jgi:hypothetical protein
LIVIYNLQIKPKKGARMSYKKGLFLIGDIKAIIDAEGGKIVDAANIEAELVKARVGYVAVFCRKSGDEAAWEVTVSENDRKMLGKEKSKPAELIFIIKSYSKFVRSLQIIVLRKSYVPKRSLLLSHVF